MVGVEVLDLQAVVVADLLVQGGRRRALRLAQRDASTAACSCTGSRVLRLALLNIFICAVNHD